MMAWIRLTESARQKLRFMRNARENRMKKTIRLNVGSLNGARGKVHTALSIGAPERQYANSITLTRLRALATVMKLTTMSKEEKMLPFNASLLQALGLSQVSVIIYRTCALSADGPQYFVEINAGTQSFRLTRGIAGSISQRQISLFDQSEFDEALNQGVFQALTDFGVKVFYRDADTCLQYAEL